VQKRNPQDEASRLVEEALSNFQEVVDAWNKKRTLEKGEKITQEKEDFRLSDYSTWGDTLLNCAFRPTYIRYFPFQVKSLSPIAGVEELVKLIGPSKNEKKRGNKGQIVYPKECAFNSNIHGISLAPFMLLKRFKTAVLASATISNYQYQLFDSISNSSLQKVAISSDKHTILDELIILVSYSNWIEHFCMNFWKDITEIAKKMPFYTLGFSLNNKRARAFFEFSKDNQLDVQLITGDNVITAGEIAHALKEVPHSQESSGLPQSIRVKEKDGQEGKEARVFQVTSALNIASTGINLGDRKCLMVNMDAYKPVSCLWHISPEGGKISQESIEELRANELRSVLIQNCGRCARKTDSEKKGEERSRRAIFLFCTERDPLMPYQVYNAMRSRFHKVQLHDLGEFERKLDLRRGTKSEGATVWDARTQVYKEATQWLSGERETFQLDSIQLVSKLDGLKKRIENFVDSQLKEGKPIPTWSQVAYKFHLFTTIDLASRNELKEWLSERFKN
jgi:hypothetical protein